MKKKIMLGILYLCIYIMYKRVNYLKVLLNLNVTMLIYFEGQLLNLGYDFRKGKIKFGSNGVNTWQYVDK